MERSAWWFILPLVLGILGSAIAWSKIRRDDSELTKWVMIFGAVKTTADALGFSIIGGLFGSNPIDSVFPI